MKVYALVLPWLLLAALPALAEPDETAPQVKTAPAKAADERVPSIEGQGVSEQQKAAEAAEAAEAARKSAQEAQAAAAEAAKVLEALAAQKRTAAEKKQKKKEEKKDKKKGRAKKGGTFQGALAVEPGLEVGARLYILWALQVEDDKPLHEFRINMARVKFSWSQWKLVEAVLKLDVDHLIEDAPRAAIVRDAYLRVMPFSWLGLRVGQFKKPYSKVELISRGKFPFVSRGISNGWIVEDLGYGERDLGLQIEGRLWKEIKLDYMFGVFNGAGMNQREQGFNGRKDLVLRLEARPAKWLSLGAGASLKFIERDDLARTIDQQNFPLGYNLDDFKDDHAWMTGRWWSTGVDLLFRFEGARLLIENLFGESWWFQSPDYRYSWSLVAQLSRKWQIFSDWEIGLEPVLRGELIALLPGAKFMQARMWQVVPGINLHLGQHIRLMVNGEFVFTQGAEPDESTADGLWPGEWPGPWRNASRLLVQLAFGI